MRRPGLKTEGATSSSYPNNEGTNPLQGRPLPRRYLMLRYELVSNDLDAHRVVILWVAEEAKG